MKLNLIEDWGMMPNRNHWRSAGWRWSNWVGGVAMWTNRALQVGLTGHVEDDGNRWLHLSVSHRERIPSYDEVVDARRNFIGDRLAYQLFVPSSEHVNVHPTCLHLWAPVDHRPTPDFRDMIRGV